MHTLAQSSQFLIFLGGLCYYLALPPVNFAPLALAVPICWGMVIRRKNPHPPCLISMALPKGEGTLDSLLPSAVCRLPSLFAVYLTAYLFWLASVYWVAFPCFPLTGFGLLVLSAVLSLYWVIFFVAARTAVHRFHVPLLVAMPLCWIGTEYLRCHIFGGFSFCALEHALYRYPSLLQFASYGGSLLVGGIIMFVGTAFVTGIYMPKRHFRIVHVLFCVLPLILLFVYVGLAPFITGSSLIRLHLLTPYSIIALQGSRQVYIDSDMKAADETFGQFIRLTRQTIKELKENEKPLPDLIVFPETVCHVPVLQFEGTVKPADIGFTEEEATQWERDFRKFADEIETPILLGLSTYTFKDNPDKPIRLNSALLVQPSVGDEPSKMYRYDKMHLVMFGEYVPFTEYLPDDFILKTVCPEAEHGTKPVAIPIGQGREKIAEASINICFESSVAHMIRKQILTLRTEGHDPQVLINLSNDGWFRFSHEIEQHLATHVFRAVENGMPYITATNGGFSAIIDRCGNIQNIGERGAAESVAGQIFLNLDNPLPQTIYLKYGDWYALPLALGVLFLVGFSLFRRERAAESQNSAG
ncbi:MAG: apolipoprotein N-acyltransferase [Planctomycetaceae bacterium]|jgi:apolipoprotein N-acyltransferase|nr:apolipoprotein N-acyltransferase [Planctomycetaceae bacterium]